MKIKESLISLAIAAALGSTGVYAQSSTHGVTPGDTSLPDPTEEGRSAGSAALPTSEPSDTVRPRSEVGLEQRDEQRDQQRAEAETGSSISADERSRAGQSSSLSGDTTRSGGESSAMAAGSADMSSDSSRMSQQQAQSDVPPPVDSDTVRHIQQALNDQGHQINVDGIWGDKTHEALKDYQSDQHLNATGQLDGETFASLGLTEGAQQTASASSQGAGSADASADQQQASADSSSTTDSDQ